MVNMRKRIKFLKMYVCSNLDQFVDLFETHYDHSLPIPCAFMTDVRNFFIEWLGPCSKVWKMSLDVDLSTFSGNWHALNIETDDVESRKLHLLVDSDWQWLNQQVREKVVT